MKHSSITRNRKEHYIRNLEFSYDKNNDLLYVYKKGSSVYSNVVIGEFHIEVDKSKKIVGMEILKASELLGEFDIPRRLLNDISSVSIKIVQNNNSTILFLIIQSQNEEKQATITMNSFDSSIIEAMAA